MADSDAEEMQAESGEAVGETAPTGPWRFGSPPGRKDPAAARAAIRQREIIARGSRPDEGNPTPPADVGTGHIGLGPAEPEPEEAPR